MCVCVWGGGGACMRACVCACVCVLVLFVCLFVCVYVGILPTSFALSVHLGIDRRQFSDQRQSAPL